jgi:hypothetical protein
MHEHHSSDYVSGEPVGPWYQANDAAIVRCAGRYLCVTRDFAWLGKKICDRTVLDHLDEHAVYWKNSTAWDAVSPTMARSRICSRSSALTCTRQPECMPATRSMRLVADLHERRGNAARAKQLRGEATEMAERMNRLLLRQWQGILAIQPA